VSFAAVSATKRLANRLYEPSVLYCITHKSFFVLA